MRVLRRLVLAVVLAAFVVACLRLGWWQYTRYQSSSGSLQNLGYTLQWPTFAIFALFAVWRLSKLERQRRDAQDAAPPEPPQQRPQPRPADDLPEDDELAAYNRYLAELNRKEHNSGR